MVAPPMMSTSGSRTLGAFPRRVYEHLAHDRLYRNSIILMLNTVALAGFGFVFWAVAAHLYSSADVGLVTALVSAAALIMTLSTLGFDNTFLRFLPRSTTARAQINTGLTLTSVAAVVISLMYIAVVAVFVPKLAFISTSVLWIVGFTIFSVLNMLNNLTNYVFVANRVPQIVLGITLLFGVVRLVMIVPMSGLGRNGLFLAYAMAIIISLLLTFILMHRYLDYKYAPSVNMREFSKMFRYTSKSYLSSIFLALPMMVLPTILVRVLGPSYAAYYYVVAVIIVAVNVIPEASAHSLFAEGSWDGARLREYTRKAFRMSAVLLVPCILVLLVFGRVILQIFGEAYERNGYALLALLALSTIPRAVSCVYSTVLRVEYRVGAVVGVYVLYAGVTLGGCCAGLWLGFGLLSLGYATLIGEACASFLFFAVAHQGREHIRM